MVYRWFIEEVSRGYMVWDIKTNWMQKHMWESLYSIKIDIKRDLQKYKTIPLLSLTFLFFIKNIYSNIQWVYYCIELIKIKHCLCNSLPMMWYFHSLWFFISISLIIFFCKYLVYLLLDFLKSYFLIRYYWGIGMLLIC